MKRILVLTALLMCALSFVPGAAFAASNGGRGNSSGGDASINAEISPLVRISSLHDIDLGTWDGQSDMSGSEPNCVWSTTGGYAITGIGSGTDGDFTITNSVDELTYTAEWTDSSGKKGKKLKAHKELDKRVTDANAQDCNGNTSATLDIEIKKGHLKNVSAGTYSGTLTLIVAVE